MDQNKLNLLARYARRLLVIDPQRRPSPSEVLDEPWVSHVDG
jgi:hypothetical protein